MKASDKDRYVEEARKLYGEIQISWFSNNPNDIKQLSIINRLIAIFTLFSGNDGDELRTLLKEFQKWARAGEREEHIENCASDMMQFIGQKIEEMDVYEIQEDKKEKTERIIDELKNENLWVRSSVEGKDLHILIGDRKDSKKGEHVHLIQDSETGEVRIDRGDQSPEELVERIVSVTTKSGHTIAHKQKGIKTTLEFFDDEKPNENIPVVYPSSDISSSGGTGAHSESFQVKNIGKDMALNIKWGIRGFAYEWRSPDNAFDLSVDQTKELIYPNRDQKTFDKEVKDLCIFFEYRNVIGINFFSRMELRQEKVPSGLFYNLQGETYHYPTVLENDGVQLVKILDMTGDRVDGLFSTGNDPKEVKIGISNTLLSVWGFNTNDQVAAAIDELGQRKVRKMVKQNQIADFVFISSDYPANIQSGDEGYAKLRDSL